MKVEPNLLLAVATGTALTLLVLTAGTFGRPDYLFRYSVIAIGFSACYVALNTLIESRAVAPPAPMVSRDVRSLPWAAFIPAFMLLAAAVPVILPGRDFALLVIVCTVLFGLTVRSAMRVTP
ncbi:hypothetical protein [Brevundimonas subvibrioides]|uniref:Uncharacterized protein n=1 Tax=Brevundimonas subvibrioides (strain ATCC 15264 / DSM 4735 / LMG 14903 / NBRC 16000 / CB 81) TaxID=633149 RepID=D9QHW1_BRESC|nr:hypothetical protein [Brevundimonas subvibrioides]ADL01219.1 hypothetical protein Bresu_1908 [Brevundimonas subvibrioides ATCC 15264]